MVANVDDATAAATERARSNAARVLSAHAFWLETHGDDKGIVNPPGTFAWAYMQSHATLRSALFRRDELRLRSVDAMVALIASLYQTRPPTGWSYAAAASVFDALAAFLRRVVASVSDAAGP